MFLMWLMVGCNGQGSEAENAKLTQRVADLERTRDRLEKDNEALKAVSYTHLTLPTKRIV